MNAKDLPKISNYTDIHLQPIRKIFITVEVIDKNGNTIEVIQGLSTGGSLNVSNSSLIRRTGSLSFVLFDSLLPRKGNILWMTNKIRIYAGLQNLAMSETNYTHFCLGTFYITEPQVDISRHGSSIGISLQDNMMRWEEKQLENKIKIEAGTPLNTAVVSLMNSFGEYNIDVEFTDLKIPYTLEFNEGQSVLDILTKLRDLYMDWECYYDVDGTFVFRQMKIQRVDGEPISWKFEKGSQTDLVTVFKESFTYKNVKNRIVVIGQMNQTTGVTPKSEVTISQTDNPFHSDEIGVKTSVIVDSSLKDNIQCDSRAKYELFKASTFQEKLTINTIPLYFLDANDIIEVTNHATQEVERYIIDSISIGLGIEDEMGLTCHKLYYDLFEMNSSIGDYQESADIIIDGIMNKGWLALAEDRISQYLGIEGDGSKLIVRFEYEGIHGVTAYTTGYFGDPVQTLTIDLADFDHVTGDSGANGYGKEEYADRILGHEMVHVVMNNNLTVDKTTDLPAWFKEGIAEYIHGADERFKLSVANSTGTGIDDTKLQAIVDRATELLNGAYFNSVTDDYSASYLAIKYLDSKFPVGKDYKNLIYSIKMSIDTGDVALKNAIVENTDFLAYADFVTNFSENAFNHVVYNMTLNWGEDEADTGSIGGSDERGNTDLNAETVFDNSTAERGVPAKNFLVEIVKP